MPKTKPANQHKHWFCGLFLSTRILSSPNLPYIKQIVPISLYFTIYILFVISSQLPTSVPNYPSVCRKIKPSAKSEDNLYTIISYLIWQGSDALPEYSFQSCIIAFVKRHYAPRHHFFMVCVGQIQNIATSKTQLPGKLPLAAAIALPKRMQRIQVRIMLRKDIDKSFRIFFYAHTVRII